MRRVVVTGVGAVSPLGVGAVSSWAALLAGKHGMEARRFDGVPRDAVLVAPAHASFAARAPHSNSSIAPRFVTLALAAAGEAVKSARLRLRTHDGDAAGEADDFVDERAGVAFGCGLGGIATIAETAFTLEYGRGYRGVSPYFVPRVLNNMAAGVLSMEFGLGGPNHAVSTACATGAHAIGDALRFIRFGDADVMLCGGTEACLDPLSVAGFARMNALGSASRPFDAAHDGFVMGEGAACLVLEALDTALARGAPIVCEVAGYGLSGDAHHVTAPEPSGRGQLACMRAALAHAGNPVVDYVNAHATGTPRGDAVEACSVAAVAPKAMVSSTKGAVGHLLGAAGAMEALFTCLAVRDDVAPHTLNLETPIAEAAGVDLVRGAPRTDRRVAVALSNSFGFGGTNCSLVFRKYEEGR